MARYFMSDTRLGWLEKMMMDPSRTPFTRTDPRRNRPQKKPPRPRSSRAARRLLFSLVLRFLFYPEQSAEQPPQTLGAFEHDYLHSADHLSLVFYAIIGGRGAECDSQLRIGPSGTVSTTTSAPFRVEMVMQSEPSAYSLLTPRG